MLVLHRPVPLRAALRARDRGAARAAAPAAARGARRHRGHLRPVRRAAAPARLRPWGAWAAPSLALALRRLRRAFPFDLVHAHYAAPGRRRRAARAARRAARRLRARRRRAVASPPAPAAQAAVRAGAGDARLVLANSAGIEARARELGAADTRVVHLGTDLPPEPLARAAARRRSSPSRTSSPASATPTCCARCGCCATPPRPALGGGRRRPGAPGARAAGGASSGSPAASSFRAARAGEAVRRRGGDRVRAAERRRGVRRRLRRGDGRRACRRSAAAARPGRRRSRAAAGHAARRARRPGRARGRAARAARRPGLARASSATAARATVERAFTWEALRPRDRRRLRGGAAVTDARPVRHQPRAAVPGRRVRRAARARGRRRSRSSAAASATAAAPGEESCRSPSCARRSATSRGSPRRALPRGRRGPSGRVALPAAYAGARRARVPFVLWATIWAHPRTAAHALSYLPLRHLYRDADAIVTYGPHVSAYVRSKGRAQRRRGAPERRRRVLERACRRRFGAPRSKLCLSGDWRGKKGLKCSFRPGAPRACRALSAALVLVGGGPFRARAVATGAVLPGTARARPNCATSMPARTLSSYRPSPRATSASRGGSSSTRLSTRAFP